LKPKTLSHARVAVKPEDFPRDGRPEVAVMGRSNVGKSSLLNRLLGRSGIARVSKTPGRTREIHYYLLDERFYLVDLPGFGYAKVARTVREGWARLMESYLDHGREAIALTVQLVDVRHDPMPLDHTLAEGLRSRELPFVVALTKGDKVSGSAAARARARTRRLLDLPEEIPVVVTSARTGQGIADLGRLIERGIAAWN
jgi:GTP-binding protein